MQCPECDVAMQTPPPDWPVRWTCPSCPRVAAEGDTAEEIERREEERQYAVRALEEVLALRREVRDMQIETQGCSACGGTMYRTIDVDEDGNPTGGGGPFVCQSCGAAG